MGQKKGLIYNAVVISVLAAIWYFTTSNIGYKAPDIPQIDAEPSAFSFTPTVLNLVISSENSTEIPEILTKNLEKVTNAFTHFADLKVNLKKILTSNPLKIKASSLDSRNIKTLVFYISAQYQNFKRANFIWIHPTNLDPILDFYSSFLRKTFGFPDTPAVLVNGLSKQEWENKEKYAENYLAYSISQEIQLYNKLNEINNRKISYELLMHINEIINDLQKTGNSYEIMRKLQELNRNPELAKEEYFQWDFKLGVYAPLFFPVLFPMSAAIYSRLFLRA